MLPLIGQFNYKQSNKNDIFVQLKISPSFLPGADF